MPVREYSGAVKGSFDFARQARYAQDERRNANPTVRPERSDAKRREVEGQADYSDRLLGAKAKEASEAIMGLEIP